MVPGQPGLTMGSKCIVAFVELVELDVTKPI